MPQPCNSLRLVLTLDRATPRVSWICSALSGLGARKKEGVNLGDGAVDAPPGAHFAPVQDEPLFDRGEIIHGASVISVKTEIPDIPQVKLGHH